VQCASVYNENHAFLTFADSATHSLWSTSGAAGDPGRHLIEGEKWLLKNLFFESSHKSCSWCA